MKQTKKERYFHLYHSISKEASQRLKFEDDLKKMKKYMMEHQDEEMTLGPKYQKYYYLHYDKQGTIFLMPEGEHSSHRTGAGPVRIFCDRDIR